MTILSASGGDAAVGVFLSIVIGLGGLFLAIVWIVFPFLVNSKFNELIREQRETNRLLRVIGASRGTEAPPTLQKPAGSPALAPPLPQDDVYRI